MIRVSVLLQPFRQFTQRSAVVATRSIATQSKFANKALYSTLGLGLTLTCTPTVFCAQEKEKEKEKEKEEVVSEAAADIQKAAAKKIEEAEKKAKDAKAAGKSFLTGLPSEISAASVLGFCAGFYLRKTSEQIAYYVGLGVIVFQGLAYLGYVSINWNRIEKDFVDAIDADKDGKITQNDFKIILSKFTKSLSTHMISGAGFTAGFWLGFRYF